MTTGGCTGEKEKQTRKQKGATRHHREGPWRLRLATRAKGMRQEEMRHVAWEAMEGLLFVSDLRCVCLSSLELGV